MQPDRDQVAEWEAVPRWLLYVYGLLCGGVIAPAAVVVGLLLADLPRWTWWVGGAVVLPAVVVGAALAAFPVLAAVVRRWPVLGRRVADCDGR